MLKNFLVRLELFIKNRKNNHNSLIHSFINYLGDEKTAVSRIEKYYKILTSILILAALHALLCIWFLRDSFLWGIIGLYLILFFISVFLFAVSTNYEKFNFYNEKKKSVNISILFLTASINSILAYIFCSVFMPLIFMIPVNQDVSKGMIVYLARFLYALFTLTLTFLAGNSLYGFVHDEYNWIYIKKFNIRTHVDLRENREFLYDLNIVKRMDNGQPYTIKEKDRQLHMILNGVTGTGKSSSGIIPAIASDLNQKAHNEDTVKSEILRRNFNFHDVFPKKAITDRDFCIENFYATTEEGDRFLKSLKTKAPSAGITLIAPNAALADEIYELAVAKGFKVNRIDPMPLHKETGELKPGYTGFNPIYISDRYKGVARDVEISRKARMTADVITSLNQKGKGDPYFSSLNKYVVCMVTMLILKTYPATGLPGHPTLLHVQEVVNDFNNVKKYLYALAKMEGLDGSLRNEDDITYEWLKCHQFKECSSIVSQIAFDLLGPGKKDMENQVRGLRVILEGFLSDPYLRNIISCENTIDLDRVLERGEITIFNFALEIGSIDTAKTFGIFFSLCFIQAVFGRSGTEKDRLLHMLVCDEFPLIVNSEIEAVFTLFRQYKVAFMCAMQTFAQFDRNEEIKYLKGVMIANVAHHLVYGRCSLQDRKMYSELAGKVYENKESTSVSQTSLTTDDPHYSYTTRSSMELTNVMEAHDIGDRAFQQVSVFGVSEGNQIVPFDGKVSFLDPKEREELTRFKYDWSSLVEEGGEENAFVKTSSLTDSNGDKQILKTTLDDAFSNICGKEIAAVKSHGSITDAEIAASIQNINDHLFAAESNKDPDEEIDYLLNMGVMY